MNTSFVVRFCLCLLLLVSFSCGVKKTEQGILTKEEMIKVLTEIYVAEDKINRLAIGPDSGQKIFDRMRAKISQRTGIPDSVVRRSLDYYTARPKEMEQIYAALVDSLNLKEQRAQE